MPKALKTVCGKLFRIFSPNKCAPAKRKKRFYTSRLPKNDEIGEIFSIKQQRTWNSSLKIQNQKLNIAHLQRLMSYPILFNGITFRLIYSGRTVHRSEIPQ